MRYATLADQAIGIEPRIFEATNKVLVAQRMKRQRHALAGSYPCRATGSRSETRTEKN